MPASAAAGEPIIAVLRAVGLAASNSEAVRKLAEGAVRVDGEKLSDRGWLMPPGVEHILQVGPRRFARVKVTSAL